MNAPLTTTTIPEFAASEYRRRRDALKAAVARGEIAADRANHFAQLWLAIARAAGAALDEMLVDRIFPPGTKGLMRASDIADPEAARAELTRARDTAARKALANPTDLRLQQHSWDIEGLARHLGCPDQITIKEETR